MAESPVFFSCSEISILVGVGFFAATFELVRPPWLLSSGLLTVSWAHPLFVTRTTPSATAIFS